MNRLLNNPLTIVITGVLIGYAFYLTLVYSAHKNLEKKILNANWLIQTIEKDPSLSGVMFETHSFEALFNTENGDKLAWRILTVSNIIDSDADIKDVGIISKLFFNNGLEIKNQIDIKSYSSIDVLINLLQFTGNSPNKESVNKELKEEIAKVLSGQGFKEYDKFLVESPNSLENFEGSDSENMIHSILNRLFLHLKVEDKFSGLPFSPFKIHGEDGLPATEELRQLRELCLQILTSIYDDPKVSRAKTILENIKGPEQNVMFCMFFVALFILVRKKISRTKNLVLDDNLSKRLKLYYSWIFSSLTAVGFIGTIRGLSQALSSADIIFRSSPGLEQSISISQITEVLGIAFATTLIALVLTLILGLIRLYLDPIDEFKIDEA